MSGSDANKNTRTIGFQRGFGGENVASRHMKLNILRLEHLRHKFCYVPKLHNKPSLNKKCTRLYKVPAYYGVLFELFFDRGEPGFSMQCA